MKNIFIAIFFSAPLLFAFESTAADIYRWTDDAGVIHVTDDPTKIPAKYWEKDRVKKEELKKAPEETQQKPKPQEPAARKDERELYGDHPLDWWAYKFRELRSGIALTSERLQREKNFVEVFEGGRGLGKVFTDEEISRYENYKADIPIQEEKLSALTNELDELQRKAINAGVPKNIRE